MMIACSDGTIPQRAGIQARRTIVVVMRNRFLLWCPTTCCLLTLRQPQTAFQTATALAKELAENGFLSDAPERGEHARIIAEAISLYEMYQPGLFTLPSESSLDAVERARQLAADALAALEANQLTPLDGDLAEGWVEVFPELTEDERRLGQLPGFTPERIEQWLETYPAEDLGLPNSTGTPVPDDPTDNIISTPIP